MTRKVDLHATSADMDHLWGEIHKTRDGTPTVKVDKVILSRLLIDHNRIINGGRIG